MGVLFFTAFLQKLVDQDNKKFEEWCSEMADMRKQSVDKGKAKHVEVKELYELLPPQEGMDCFFLKKEKIKKIKVVHQLVMMIIMVYCYSL